eukprot:CAMPEP_0182879798 /NCGR_PEP_ID=MMETSP0034_2-20130328/16195_1 /TAXON_ID=156128 /ORGANISM="Nephroselmis pyriformis, Strain CCMP717" /LENGTH=93 /DNA_ID=CAMNT_0025012759 /DNA_START=162 /DNA_END=443 /DNA_ORIENTATION=-
MASTSTMFSAALAAMSASSFNVSTCLPSFATWTLTTSPQPVAASHVSIFSAATWHVAPLRSSPVSSDRDEQTSPEGSSYTIPSAASLASELFR